MTSSEYADRIYREGRQPSEQEIRRFEEITDSERERDEEAEWNRYCEGK